MRLGASREVETQQWYGQLYVIQDEASILPVLHSSSHPSGGWDRAEGLGWWWWWWVVVVVHQA